MKRISKAICGRSTACAGLICRGAVCAALALVPLVTSSAYADSGAASPYRKLEIFARALAHIEQSYVSSVDEDELIHGAIRGMLQVLDPHSSFLDAEQYRILSSDAEGRYGGIGVEIDVRDGWLTVVSVFAGGPAERAGLRPGDRFVAIEGLGARDMQMDEALERMRGEPGTRVRVTLRRPPPDAKDPATAMAEAKTIEATLAREIIEVRAVEARVLPDRVTYLRIRMFQETTASELRAALAMAVERTAAKGGVQGVLLDLRDNPGGLLSSAVLVADEFLDEGVIVTTRGRDERVLRERRASAGPDRPRWPMVVLVNGYSASAAEIVAGALRDHHRAVLVGTRTFGKGSVQNIIELPDQSALKLTTALYYTPAGVSIQAQGIEPDVTVEQIDSAAFAKYGTGRDDIREATLDRHLDAADAALSASRVDPFPDDFQARVGHQILTALVAAQR